MFVKRYYRIGELSKLYDIGRDAIKYYEELNILVPTRDSNGYRNYSIDDVCKLNLIRELRNLNIPMKEIKEYLKERNLKSTREMLEEEIKIVNEKIDDLLKQKKSIENRLCVIEKGIAKTDFGVIKVEYHKRRKALILDGNVNVNENIDFLIQKLRKELKESFYMLGNNNIGSIFDFESLKNGIINKYKHVIAFLDDESDRFNFELAEGIYLTCTYKGSYDNNQIYLPEIFKYVEDQGYKIIGDPMEIYKVDIYETSEIKEFITTLQVQVKKK
ncbi:MerR family transcriptional regulator [Clostridium sp. ZS1]|uniref:MerR family transcriptional regulator n=1 Tax=Clostridium sp. ZS1 TaxID=2949989 RepID=UPI0020793E55|nr:MerR family transcriptional regulator [Clostridium sp. ZS1]